jgi:predicted nucleic acid-binding protein
MRQVFVDTSAWDALADSRDAHHELALLFRQEIADRAQLVITDYVLDELYTLLLLNAVAPNSATTPCATRSWTL